MRSESAAILRELHLHKSGVLFQPDEGGAGEPHARTRFLYADR